jgi:type VI protein secretion system component Hcp
MAIIAEYDGIDGQSRGAGHDKWISVSSVNWMFSKPAGGTGMSGQRGAVVVRDLLITTGSVENTRC